MSASPSRRDLFRGLFAAGLAWVGLRHTAKAAPVTPPQPLTDATSRLTGCYSYAYNGSGHVTTTVYDIQGRVLMQQDGFGVTDSYTYYYNSASLAAPQTPAEGLNAKHEVEETPPHGIVPPPLSEAERARKQTPPPGPLPEAERGRKTEDSH